MGDQEGITFSRLRAFFWPVHGYELKKFLPMMLILFFLSLNYNLLRAVKDTLVVTARASGAEAIPFIKVWVMFPSAIGLTFLFTRLCNRFKRETVIYTILGGFLSYFAFFLFVLYPSHDLLHPHQFADHLQANLPSGFKGFIALFRNWTFTTFYVMSELWSNIVLFLVFWGFANQVTRLGEAKRFYGLFGVGANISGMIAGQISVYVSQANGSGAWDQTLHTLILLVLVTGVCAIALFRWIHMKVLTNPNYYDPEEECAGDKKKVILSVRKSFRYLLKSPYLMGIAFIVVAYNVAINLVEVVWKDQMKQLYPNPTDYNTYFSQVMTVIGGVATFTSLFLSSNLIRKWGWTITAMVTPCIVLISGGLFFFFFLGQSHLGLLTESALGMTPLMAVVFLGSAQNVLSRAAKYTVYDATKEVAFVPLDKESKLKGKAAIDGVCSRLGKSAGSLIHQMLLLSCSSLTASAPFVAIILFALVFAWMGVTRSLGKQFYALTAQKPDSRGGEQKPAYSFS